MSLRLPRLLKLDHLLCSALALCTGMALAAPETQSLPSPYYREAEFYRYQSQSLLALGSLLAAQKQDLLSQDRNAADLLLGQLYREYDLPGQAADCFQRASGTGVGSLRGKAWWELAVRSYQRGDHARANDALVRSTGLLPYDLEKQRPLLQARILLALNRNAEAVALLKAWQPIQQQEPYTRYNVGVAQVRAGDLLQGAGMLDSVGTMPAPDAELQALRDQANLAMGYGFLRADHGATARPMFKRVQLDGPYSSLALLGAGWAELAPDGKPQQNLYLSPVGCVEDPSRVLPESLLILRRPPRSACDRERTFKSRVFFEQSPGADSEAERYRLELIPWQTLIRRNPADPAVQEALLAVPYAYSRLKGREQAIEHYRNAIHLYETERKQLLRVTTMIRETPPLAMPASPTSNPPQAWNLPRAEDMHYLGPLIASDPFQAALRDLQALRTLRPTLQPVETRLASLESRLYGSAQLLAVAESVPDTSAPKPETAPQPAQADPDSNSHISYFGVFDFIPPSKAPDDVAAPIKDVPALETVAVVEPEPVAPPHRQLRGNPVSESPMQRHAQLRTRLQAVQKQIADSERAYERVLRQMALAKITEQQERLDTYLAQARFSLARLLDPAVTDNTGF